MHTPRHVPGHTRTHNGRVLRSKSSLRFAAIVNIAAILFAVIAVLAFAQKPKAVLRTETQTTQPSRVAMPRLLAPIRRALRGNKLSGNQEQEQQQEQEPTPRDQQEKRSGGHGRPQEGRMRKARPFKGDVRQLPYTQPIKVELPEQEAPEPNPSLFVPAGETANSISKDAAAAAPQSGIKAPAPPPTANFEGLDFNTFGSGHPPDTNGDVGPNYYVQAINTSIGIFDKSSGTRVAAFSFNTFMSQGHFGNLCDTNNQGDPVVLYDTFEDRWVITDLAYALDGSGVVINPPGAFQCFAVSQSGDPVSGGWNFYSINTAGGLGDYPKFGIWRDGLYMSANMYNYARTALLNSRVYAFNKAQMYAGAPSVQMVSFDAAPGDFTLLPSNARLQTGTPPAGTPNYYLSTWLFNNAVTVYKFHVDWDHLSLSTFTGPTASATATSWPNASIPNAPSQGGNSLDVVQIRAMMQNQYTNIGGAESLWATHTVHRGVDATGFAAPRFYQVPVTGGTIGSAIQAATFDPDGANVIYRFIPSLAVDRAGNMALGYSTSSSTTKPAIKYAGRLATDPINTFSQTEQVLIQGVGTQTGNCGGALCTRWGDYSSMTLDPDGCNFWYTNMYYPVDGLNHHTRIGSFALPQCTTVGQGRIQGTVTSSSGGGPINGATVTLGSRTTTTDASGFYAFSGLPAGNYPDMTAGLAGYTSASVTNVAVSEGVITTQNFVLSPGVDDACLTDTTQLDFQRGVPNSVDLTTSPGNVMLPNVVAVDQQNTILGASGFSITTAQWIGQTFMPAVSGNLTKLDINLSCSSCSGPDTPITVEIRPTNGTLPTAAVLASSTIPGFSVANPAYYTATFSSPPALTAGTTYAIITKVTTNRAGNYSATFGTGNPYSTGLLVFGNDSSWNPIAGDDLGFRTYMQSGYPPAGNLVSGLFDANPHSGGLTSWTNLSWNASTPAGTSVKFQVAASNSANGPFTFVGPDGTSGTFFTTSGASLSRFNGSRYLKYQAFLGTSSNTITPVLNDVTLCYHNTLPTALTVNSATGTYGGNVNLSATLTDGVSPLSSRTINFALNGNNVGSGVTDGSGVATLHNVSLTGIGANTYPTGVSAAFTGDATFLASNATNTLTVNKADAHIVVTPYNVPFDGNSHTAAGTATGVNSENLNGLDLSGTTHTNAANYSGDHWTFTDVTGNYNNASGTVDDAITQVSSTTKITVGNATYDGSPHGGTASLTGAGGLNQSLTVTYSGRNTTVYGPTTTPPTNSGDYTASASYAGDANHTSSNDSKDYSIFSAGSVTQTSVSDATYDGNPHGGSASVTGAGGLSQSVAVTYSGRNSTVYGPTATPPTNAGDYTASASYSGDANHTSSNDSKDYSIFSAGSVTQTSVSDATYDGNPHGGSASVTGAGGLSQSVTVTYSGRNGTVYGPSAAPPTNAGDYTASASYAGDANHTSSNDSRGYSIFTAGSVTQASVSDATYDGSPHGGSATVSGAGGLSQSLTVTYSGRNGTVYGPTATPPTNAGDYTASASFGGDQNHTSSSDAKDYSIQRASSITAVTVANASFDTNPHGGTAFVTGAGGLNQTLTVGYSGRNSTVYGPSNTAPANAGDYTASASFGGDANHTGSSDAKDFSIVQTSSATSVFIANATYDGSPHGGTASVTGTGGLNQTLTVTYAGRNTTVYGPSITPPTNGGDYTASASYAGDVNHDSSSDSKSFSILRASSLTQAIASNATYDGNPHGGSASVTGVAGLNQSLVVTYAGRNTTVYGPSTTPPTNAGDYTASASYAGDVNHAGSSDSQNYSIAKASSTTTVTCPGTLTSTGAPLTPCTASATGAGGLNAGLPVDYTNNVVVGTATASASYAGDVNHLPSSGSATFAITATAAAFNFVIGDNNAKVGATVTFWGARWARLNSMSGGPAPASFKGFAGTQPPSCGGAWTSDPGGSSGPPAAVPEFITVIVSSSITQSGQVISGNSVKLVIVKTNPGYGPDPSQAGTGTVVSVVCP